MSDYICDDRLNLFEFDENIKNMTDEQFEAYCNELKNNEKEKHPK